MKEKKNCKIIQDLLPSYIEKLTKDETNLFIEEHLNECEECNSICKKLQKNIDININKDNKKQIDYLKKYNKKMRILKSIISNAFSLSFLFILIHTSILY